MVETLKETLLKSIPLLDDKEYAVFNKHDFFIITDNVLKGLNTLDLDITQSEILSNLSRNGTHIVAQFDSMNELLDFYNSKKWTTYN